MADEQPQTTAAKQLLLQKIYVKDLSFESPKAPAVFTTNASPQTQLSIRTGSQSVAPSTSRGHAHADRRGQEQDATIFLVEIAQAGIFHIEGYNAEEQGVLIGTLLSEHAVPVRARGDRGRRSAAAASRSSCSSRSTSTRSTRRRYKTAPQTRRRAPAGTVPSAGETH
jgi:preprotein translocase subunit SecB